MAFIIQKPQELARPDLTGKIIKAEDFLSYQSAKDLVVDAKKSVMTSLTRPFRDLKPNKNAGITKEEKRRGWSKRQK